MKKIVLIFCALMFANISVGFGAYFYADAVEQAIQQEFPEYLQSSVANEYEAQMNQNTGEIDERGMYNVCYAGGYDVSTESGAENCSNFVKILEKTCVYTQGSSYKYYTNPTTREQRIDKCLFDKAMEISFKYEGGLQQNVNDPGSRICDENGNPLREANGNFKVGATKYGITTCYTHLPLDCVKNMTKQQALSYYWTHLFYGYGYYKLPPVVRAAVMQFAVAGVGKVANELKQVVGAMNCKDAKINDCIYDAVKNYLDTKGVIKFHEELCNLHAKPFKVGGKYWQRAMDTKKLSSAYEDCAKLYK